MTDFARLLSVLFDAKIEYILVGGVAATAHGSSSTYSDLGNIWSRVLVP